MLGHDLNKLGSHELMFFYDLTIHIFLLYSWTKFQWNWSCSSKTWLLMKSFKQSMWYDADTI